MSTIVVAGGFNDYAGLGDQAELRDSMKNQWFPGTPDFLRTSADSGVSSPWVVDDKDEFLGAVVAAGRRGISRLVFIGHGSPSGLGLSGSQRRAHFSRMLRREDFQAPAYRQSLPGVRWHRGATVDLFACNAGAGPRFMQAMADALGVPVRGFGSPIWWCLGHDPQNTRITSRGRVAATQGPGGRCGERPWRKGVSGWVPPRTFEPTKS